VFSEGSEGLSSCLARAQQGLRKGSARAQQGLSKGSARACVGVCVCVPCLFVLSRDSQQRPITKDGHVRSPVIGSRPHCRAGGGKGSAFL
jgi:hypothetical protein